MVYRFAEFELSEEDFSLRRDGKRIPLEPRALGVLLALAANPGRLLDKKSLLQAVWKDTFVEETTLTRAIALVRKQLSDDAREPRYIETVPTRGYRFIATIDSAQPGLESKVTPGEDAVQTTADPPEASLEVPVAEVATSEEARVAGEPTEIPGSLVFHRSYIALAATVCILLVSIVVLHFARSKSAPAPFSEHETLVLADFRNTTGDAAFDIALRQGMLVALEQSPMLHLASDVRIRKTLRLMGRHDDGDVPAQVAQEVCQRLGGSVVLDGSISRLGSAFVIGLRARRCGTGEELDAEQVQVARKEDALHAVSQIAARFRQRLGESAATVQEHDTPLPEATTPSLEALSAFSRGMQAFNTKGSAAAVPLFQYATELDPDFAWAHAWLGRMYADLGREDLAEQSTRRAHDLRARASDRERFTIDVSYDLLVTGNLESARNACVAWMQMYPRDIYPRAFLATTIYPAFGQYDRALAEARQMIALDPDFVAGYRDAAISLIALDRPSEAKSVLRSAAERKVYLPSFVTDAYRIAFLQGDTGGMEQALRTAPRNPWLLYYHSATLARSGRLAESQDLQAHALGLARQSSRQDTEAELLVSAAYTDLFYGYPERSVQAARRALKLQSGRYTRASAALVLAMAGFPEEASSSAVSLRRQFPDDTVLQHNFLPSVQAAVALDRKKPQAALDLLEANLQPEVNLPLYPTYLRGQALLALRRGPQAAATFRAILDRPGVVLNDPLWNAVQLNLARAHALSGNREEAAAAVQAVQKQWSGPEGSFPALRQISLMTQPR